MFEWKKDKKENFLGRLERNRPTLYFFVDLILNIIVIVALVYGVRTYVVSPFQVYGPSMCDTLNSIKNRCQESFGEYLIVNKGLYYPFFGRRFSVPQRGDIIVFRPPHNPDDFYIKRIIGLPGEKITIQNGKIFVSNKEHQSGIELKEEYLSPQNKNKTYPLQAQLVTSYTVPKDRYFVLGDNRNKSTDSRHCFRGPGDRACNEEINHFLEIEHIEGKAWVVLWPFSKIRQLENPAYGL